MPCTAKQPNNALMGTISDPSSGKRPTNCSPFSGLIFSRLAYSDNGSTNPRGVILFVGNYGCAARLTTRQRFRLGLRSPENTNRKSYLASQTLERNNRHVAPMTGSAQNHLWHLSLVPSALSMTTPLLPAFGFCPEEQ